MCCHDIRECDLLSVSVLKNIDLCIIVKCIREELIDKVLYLPPTLEAC